MPMNQLSTNDQLKQKLITLDHRMAFDNETSPYRKMSYDRHEIYLIGGRLDLGHFFRPAENLRTSIPQTIQVLYFQY